MALQLEASDIEWVKGRLSSGGVSRTGLSVELCERKGWYDNKQRPRSMAARLVLGRLDRARVISLPAPVRQITRDVHRPHNEVQAAALASETVQTFSAEEVSLKLVDGAEEKRCWRELMEQHHYLGAGPLCGAQLTYLVYLKGEPVGGLAFSAAAYALGARDKWIGWSELARRTNLSRVVCNSRFLLTVRIPNFASHVLSLATTRLADDWHTRYGIRPLLVETFVEKERFAGICYRAANWKHVGDTTGRGRNDTNHECKVPIKSIFVLPLAELWHWQKVLCREPVKELPSESPWAENEFGAVDLGDTRLTKRLVTVAEDFFSKPTANIPQACGSRAKTKAVYRLCADKSATMDTLLSCHYESTLSRCAKHNRVFAIQDTTTLNYSTHLATEDLGPIGGFGAKATLGLLVHSTFMINEAATPLGMLHVQCWARDNDESTYGTAKERRNLPIEDKESYKWLKGFNATLEAANRAPNTEFVVMGDREADIFELFNAFRQSAPENLELLIRAQHPRNIKTTTGEDASLWEHVARQPLSGEVIVAVPRSGNRKARDAQVELRFADVQIQPPEKLASKPQNKPVRLWAVAATEVDTPQGVEPLQWLLISTLPVTTHEEAVEKVQWYTKRWNIEVFHRTLKSGCRIENRQLQAAHSIQAALSIDIVVAWRIFHLAKLGREVPDAPCTIFFEENEWKALMCFTQKTPIPPQEPPSLKQALLAVAMLGGFLGRKSDGMPGTQTLWRGLERLSDISNVYGIFCNSS